MSGNFMGLELLCLHAWKLSSNLFASWLFEGGCKGFALNLRRSTAYVYLWKWSRFNGVVEGISLQGRPLFCGMQSFSCICGGGWSYLTLLLRAIEPPSLVGANLAAIRIISIKFSSTKRHVHRESLSHQNETCPWFSGALRASEVVVR